MSSARAAIAVVAAACAGLAGCGTRTHAGSSSATPNCQAASKSEGEFGSFNQNSDAEIYGDDEYLYGIRDPQWAQRMEAAIAKNLVEKWASAVDLKWVKCWMFVCVLRTYDRRVVPRRGEPIVDWSYSIDSVLLGSESGSTGVARVDRLWRHPADRTGRSEDGRPSLGRPPQDPCLEGASCKSGGPRGYAAEFAWRLYFERDNPLCFPDAESSCRCWLSKGHSPPCNEDLGFSGELGPSRASEPPFIRLPRRIPVGKPTVPLRGQN